MVKNLLVVSSDQVLLPEHDEPCPATIAVDVDTGKITHVGERDLSFPIDINVEYIDAGNKVVLPGQVDTHVHLNEPGREAWEGFLSGSRASVAGGVTTVVDMPLNSVPPTTTVSNLEKKREAAKGQCFSDVAFWGGVIPGNEDQLSPLVENGVKGFKCFLIDSGVEEFPCVTESDLHQAMSKLRSLPTVLLFHAEFGSTEDSINEDPNNAYTTFLKSRPVKLEEDAISLITSLQRTYPDLCCHIVHLSAASALPIIRAAKSIGLKLTVETCFHYLTLASEDVPDSRCDFKCCPPVRNKANQDALWAALMDGTIDFVVSDHSPCVSELKRLDEGDFMKAWGGISVLGLGFSLFWSEASKKGLSLRQVVDWTCTKTAQHASLGDRKGSLKVGYDGDFVIWDLDKEFTVTKDHLQFKNKHSPYEGMTLKGRVLKTYLRGRLVYDDEKGVGSPSGILL